MPRALTLKKEKERRRKISEYNKKHRAGNFTICAQCGNKIHVPPSHIRKHNFCNHSCHSKWQRLHPISSQFQKGHKTNIGRTGKNASGFKTGRYIDNNGYRRILRSILPKEDQVLIRDSGNNGGYILEHRYFMAKKLGRGLRKCEIVHHKNAKRADNRLSNLQLVLQKDHAGKMFCPYCNKKIFLK